jgi:hypothetical protein
MNVIIGTNRAYGYTRDLEDQACMMIIFQR